MALDVIKFYPNYLHYDSTDPESSKNMDFENEPSVSTTGGSASWYSSNGETSGPAYDLVDGRRDKQITVESTTETVTFDIDLTSSITIDTILIDNHNTEQADLSIKVTKGTGPTTINPNAAYASSQTYPDEDSHGFLLDQSLTVGASGAYTNNTPNVESHLALWLLEFSSDHSSTDFSLEWDYLSGTTWSDDLLIGEICFSKSWQAPHAPEIPFVNNHRWGSNYNSSLGGQKTGYMNHGERKSWRMTWRNLTKTQAEDAAQVYRVCKGPAHPFYVDLGENSSPLLYYCRFIPNGFTKRRLTANSYEITFEFETEY